MSQMKKIVRPVVKEFRKDKCGFHHSEAHDFVKSQWQNRTKSTIYLAYRWFMAIFFVGVVINSVVDNGFNGFYFIYLTHWGILMCMGTHLLGAYLVTLWHYHPEYADKINDTNSMPKAFKVYWAMHITTLVVSIVITIVYWSLIYNEKTPITSTSVLTHAFNSIMMFLDLLIVAYPVRIFHAFLPTLFGASYATFSAIYYFAGGTDENGIKYVYKVLDWSHPEKAIVTVIGTLILVCFMHVFMFSVYRIRVFIYKRLIEKSTILPTTLQNGNASSAVVTYPPKGISMALGNYGGGGGAHENKAFTHSTDMITSNNVQQTNKTKDTSS